jgi:4-nitrophenyl phosphatase
MTWLLDCDGVVWLADEPIPGAAEAVSRLRSSGQRVVMLTNNSYPRRSDHLAKLERMGMPTGPDDVLTSAMAAAFLLEPGERALVLGGPGVIEELTARNVATVRPGTGDIGTVDAVVVGMDPSFDYASLAVAATAIQAGARLIGTNEDATFPTPKGVLPGAGSLLAAVATAGQTDPIVAGKPHSPTVSLVHERIGEVDIVVGDRPSTDGLLARRLRTRFGLVLTGVTNAGHAPLDPEPDREARDLLSLVKAEHA